MKGSLQLTSRRTFLKWIAATTGLAAASAAGVFSYLRLRNWALLGGNAPVNDELNTPDLKIEGEIPRALRGTYIRNGPNPIFPRANYRFWDGDGMLHAVTLTETGARYRNRYVRTQAFFQESQAQKSLHPFPYKENPPVNRANAAVLAFAGDVLAVSSTGPAMQIDLSTLDTLSLYNFHGQWNGGISPRTKIDPDNGDLHFWAERSSSTCYYKVFGRDGKIKHETEINFGVPAIMLDFAITPHYTLFSKAPQGLKGVCQIGRLARAAKGETIEWLDVSTGCLQASINAFEDGDEIVLHGLRDPNGDRSTARPHEWRLNFKNKTVAEKPLSEKMLLTPEINPSFVGKSYQFAYLGDVANLRQSVRLCKLHVGDDKTKDRTFEFGQNSFGGDFSFVGDPARKDKEDGGWLVGFVLNESREESWLYIIDTEKFELTARARCPRRVPYGRLGTWIPQ